MGELSYILLKYPLLWSLLFTGVGIGASYILLDRLPDPIPLHWGPDGLPDGFAPRDIGIFLFPLIGLVISVALQVATWLDKSNREHSDSSKLTINTTVLLPSGVLLGVHAVVLETATHTDATLTADKLFTLVGLLLVACGFVLRNVDPNIVVGICNKWTLESRRVWDATHMFAYRACLASGLLCFVLLWIIPPGILEEVMLILLILVPLVGALIYSYIIRDRPTYSAAHWDMVTGAEPLIGD